MMSGSTLEGKEAGLDMKIIKGRNSSPSSPRTPSPAASVITLSSATDKSKAACDEASCSGVAWNRSLSPEPQSHAGL